MIDIRFAAEQLSLGHLVAFPTETVYGLGADAENQEAVARIYSVKGRPSDHPLIVHIHSIEQAQYWAREVPDYALNLAETFWPGPMTLILPRSDSAKDFITGSQDSVGLRIPNNEIALELLRVFSERGGYGVAAPSANRFGKVSPTTREAVLEELSEFLSGQDVVLDGGASNVGIESTIIDCTSSAPRILRPGSITAQMIEAVTGLEVADTHSGIRVSGALDNHYAPRAKVVLDIAPEAGDGFIAMANEVTPEGVVRICSPISVEDYAHQLYSALRTADQKNLARVVAWQPTGDGLAFAIRDRLQKASAKQD